MKSGLSIPAALCIIGLAAADAAAAAPPRSIKHLADRGSLTGRDRGELRDYGDYWVGALVRGDPPAVDAAKNRLAEPLQALQVTAVFRLEYSQVLLPGLGPVIAQDDIHAAVAAIQVTALLGTPDALDVLMGHADIANEARFPIRLWVARVFPGIVKEGIVPDNDVNRALRQFQRAAEREDDWLVLRRQFEAIASVNSPLSRDALMETLKTTASRMKQQGGPSELMRATYPAVVKLRDEYIRLTPGEQESMGKVLAPILSDLCSVADLHWDKAQGDDEARKSYGGTVEVSESLLKFIDANVRPRNARLSTELGLAWNNRQKARFDADHDKWQEAVSGPPYTRPR